MSAAAKPIELFANFVAPSIFFHVVLQLVNAAQGVSAFLDAIADLLGVLKDFTVRLKIYGGEGLSPELRENLTEVLTTVIEILARSTEVIKAG